jgi:hypothetical protein
MNIPASILIPFVFQLIFIIGIIMATNGTGSFVGLGAMLLGIFALPITALLNWLVARNTKVWINGLAAIICITAIFPAFISLLFLAEM